MSYTYICLIYSWQRYFSVTMTHDLFYLLFPELYRQFLISCDHSFQFLELCFIYGHFFKIFCLCLYGGAVYLFFLEISKLSLCFILNLFFYKWESWTYLHSSVGCFQIFLTQLIEKTVFFLMFFDTFVKNSVAEAV